MRLTTLILVAAVALTGFTTTASADHEPVTHTIDDVEQKVSDEVLDKTKDDDYSGIDCYSVLGSWQLCFH